MIRIHLTDEVGIWVSNQEHSVCSDGAHEGIGSSSFISLLVLSLLGTGFSECAHWVKCLLVLAGWVGHSAPS